LEFENGALRSIIDVYEKECSEREEMLRKRAEGTITAAQKETSASIRKLIGLTLHMQNSTISPADMQNL
jgi:hypothetical protein